MAVIAVGSAPRLLSLGALIGWVCEQTHGGAADGVNTAL